MIHFVSLTEADKSGLLDQIPQSIRFKSFHLISPSGDIQSGAEALIDLITLPAPRTQYFKTNYIITIRNTND